MRVLVWMMLAAALVFVMHLGFAALESGMTQSKNTVNILFKNVFIICAGILTYAACGLSNFTVVRGYQKDKIAFDGITYYDNLDFENNNQDSESYPYCHNAYVNSRMILI